MVANLNGPEIGFIKILHPVILLFVFSFLLYGEIESLLVFAVVSLVIFKKHSVLGVHEYSAPMPVDSFRHELCLR